MIKKLLSLVVLLSAVQLVQAQGTVIFQTRTLPSTPRVFNTDGITALGTNSTGSSFLAQLYAVAGTTTNASSLVPVGLPVNFRTGVNSGYVQDVVPFTNSLGQTVSTITVQVFSGGTAGGPATVQLRAWSAAFSTYESALSGGGAAGGSPLLNLASTGDGGTVLPVALTGLQSFSLNVVPVPEPTTLALAGLSALGLVLLRKRN